MYTISTKKNQPSLCSIIIEKGVNGKVFKRVDRESDHYDEKLRLLVEQYVSLENTAVYYEGVITPDNLLLYVVSIICKIKGIKKEQEVVLGNVDMDGRIYATQSIFAKVLLSKESGYSICYIPFIQSPEAELVDGMILRKCKTIDDIINWKKKDDIHTDWWPIVAKSKSKKEFLERNGTIFDYHHLSLERGVTFVAAGVDSLFVLEDGFQYDLVFNGIRALLPELNLKEAVEQMRERSLDNKTILSLENERPVIMTGSYHNRRIRRKCIKQAHRGVLIITDALHMKAQDIHEFFRDVALQREKGIKITVAAFSRPCSCGHYQSTTKCCYCSSQQIRNTESIIDLWLSYLQCVFKSEDNLTPQRMKESNTKHVMEQVAALKKEGYEYTGLLDLEDISEEYHAFFEKQVKHHHLRRKIISIADLISRLYRRNMLISDIANAYQSVLLHRIGDEL